MHTIKEMIDKVSKYGEDIQEDKYWILFGNYLDYFYHSNRTDEERLELIREEPYQYDIVSDYLYSLTAASVHQLCIKYKLTPPRWVMNRKYVLDIPHFSMNAKGDLRLILLLDSPPAFKMRNLFVSSNTLSRV